MATETRKSFCRFCHAACAIEVDVDLDSGRAIAVRGDRSNPMFRGYTCIKGRQLPEQHNHPDRLRASYARTGAGELETIDSGRAMDEIAGKLSKIIEEHGPRSVAMYCGTAAFQSATTLAVARSWITGIGSPSFYTSLTIDQPAKVFSYARVGMWQGGIHSFESADVVMMIGNNPLISHYSPQGSLPGFSAADVLNRNQKRGVKLIVIDPRRTELAKRADIHLQLIPGEDVTLLSSMIRLILEEGLHDQAFCDEFVAGVDELRAAVEPYDLEYAAGRSGVPADQIAAAARLFAAGPRGSVGTGTGPSMSPRASLTEQLVASLNAILGRYNRAGEIIANPGMMTPPRPYAAHVAPAEVLTKVFRAGEPSRIRGLLPLLGEQPTAALAEEILTPGEGQIRALINVGGNPVVAFPDQLRVIEALDSLDLHVCLDVLMGATAKRANYVIGSTLCLERPDVPTTIDGWFERPYTHYTPAIVESQGDVLGEWEFFYGLAQRMGTEIALPGGPLDLENKPSADDVLTSVYAAARLPMDEARKHDGGHIYDEVEVEVEAKPEGSTARLLLTPEGVVDELAEVRAETMAAEYVPGFDPAVHTHRLISRRMRHVLNSTGTHISKLREKGETNNAWMHPDDLAALGLESGDVIEIRSTRAAIFGVVAASDDVRPGVISMAHAHGDAPEADGQVREIGAPTGRLSDATVAFDPLTGMPVQSAIPVAIKAVSESALR